MILGSLFVELTVSQRIRREKPSTASWMKAPNGASLSHPSTCHKKFGPGVPYRLLLSLRCLRHSTPSSPKSEVRSPKSEVWSLKSEVRSLKYLLGFRIILCMGMACFHSLARRCFPKTRRLRSIRFCPLNKLNRDWRNVAKKKIAPASCLQN